MEAKVEAIRKFNPPTTKKKLRSFLGLAGYHRRFIPGYAELTLLDKSPFTGGVPTCTPKVSS